MRTGRLTALVRVLAVGAAVTVSGQQPPRPTFRVSSDLVVVDLLATDRDGRFVADLQPSEISVFQDGRPQRIEFVRLVRAESGRAAAAAPRAATPAGAGADAAAPPVLPASPPVETGAPVSLVVVVDLQSTPAEALSFVKDAITRMAAELPEGSRMAVATLGAGVTVHQPLTPNMADVRSVVQGLSGPNGLTPGLSQIVDAADHLCDVSGSRTDTRPGFQQTLSMAKMLTVEWQKQLTLAAEGLGSLATSLGAQPGRKHVVLYSSGYALNPAHAVIDIVAGANAACSGVDPGVLRRQVAEELAPFASFDASPAMQQLSDRANRAQVSFYAVDSRGLVPGNVQARQRASGRMSRGGQLTKVVALEATLPQEFLRAAAAETGGRAFLNTNDLTSGMRSAWADASEYYLVGYTPAGSPKKGTFHRIEVKVARPNLGLKYRSGYYEATEREVATRQVENAMRMPDAFSHTGLRIEANAHARTLRVVAYLPPTAVEFVPKDGVHLGEISLHATLHDAAGKIVKGKPLFGKDIGLRFTQAQVDGMRASDNVEIPVEVDAPAAGTYVLTVVARASGGWIGARTMALAVSTGP